MTPVLKDRAVLTAQVALVIRQAVGQRPTRIGTAHKDVKASKSIGESHRSLMDSAQTVDWRGDWIHRADPHDG